MDQNNNVSCVYVIDQFDALLEFNTQWNVFALENNAIHILDEKVKGKPIWDFISGLETKTIYKMVLNRVRSQKKEVKFKYRCDSPNEIRHMMMEIQPCSNNNIKFNNILLEQINRSYLPLFDKQVPRNETVITSCAWCMKIKANEHWLEIETALNELNYFNTDILPKITHGICESCSHNFLV